jgi:hypothetical protein
MEEKKLIPMFPLMLLPIPGELVPLHIFEPRYRQLLHDCETSDIDFGIYCNHELNKNKIGSLMKLESIIKRYPTGEADIIARCVDNFRLDKLYRTYETKMYPGGDASLWKTNITKTPDVAVTESFLEFQRRRNITDHFATFSLYQIAVELNLDLFDRYKFLLLDEEKKMLFVGSQLKYLIHLLKQEEESKGYYHLN